MKIVNAVKIVGKIAVTIGVGAVAGAFLNALMPSNVTKFGKVAMWIGTMFIGGVLVEEAGKKWDSQVDDVVNLVNAIKAIKETQNVELKPETEAE